jgi:uncharacterized membrane protein
MTWLIFGLNLFLGAHSILMGHPMVLSVKVWALAHTADC